MARNPTLKAVSFHDLAHNYGAIDFQDAITDFIAQFNNPRASGASLHSLASNVLIPFCFIHMHHRFKFSNLDDSEIVDGVQVWPEQKDACGLRIPSRFDTVLVHGKSSQDGVVPGVSGEF